MARKKSLAKKLASKKFLRGRTFNRVALVVAGPLAPVVKMARDVAIGKKASLAQGNIKIPKSAVKILKKVPVVGKLPGLNRGYIGIKTLLSPKMLLAPVKAIKSELKSRKKAKKRPVEAAAEAVAEGAAEVADEQGITTEQVVEQPQNDAQVQEEASEALAEQKQYLQEELAANRKEQAIRRAELEQMSLSEPGEPEIEEARSREDIVEDQSKAAFKTLRKIPRKGMKWEPDSPEGIKEVSETVSEQWMEEEADQLEAAEAEEEILEDAIETVEQAENIVETEGEEGFQGLMGLIRGK